VKAALYATHDRGPALMGSPAKCREVAESAHPDREGACHQRRYARFRHADRRVAGSEPRCGTSSSQSVAFRPDGTTATTTSAGGKPPMARWACSPRPPGATAGFAGSRERFETVLGWLGGEQAGTLEHSELEAHLQADARELFPPTLSIAAAHLALHGPERHAEELLRRRWMGPPAGVLTPVSAGTRAVGGPLPSPSSRGPLQACRRKPGRASRRVP